jgi:hypothetical protein
LSASQNQEFRPFDIAFAQFDAVKASAVSVKRALGYELTATVAACLSSSFRLNAQRSLSGIRLRKKTMTSPRYWPSALLMSIDNHGTHPAQREAPHNHEAQSAKIVI